MANLAHTAALALACVPAVATAQTLIPVVSFSVHDEPVDGLGDSFNSAGFSGLIRTQSTRADRAMQEFDVTSLNGQLITSATLTGQVSVNNAANNGTRRFEFSLYRGNGQADLSDYEASALSVGLGSYAPPSQSSFTYSFDVTRALQTLVDCGASHVGLKVTGVSNPNFPNVLSASMSQLNVTSGGVLTPWTDLGLATPGTNGSARLVAAGALTPGNTASMTLCDAAPGAPSAIMLGFSRADLPVFGVTLVPFPDLSVQLGTSALGTVHLNLDYAAPGLGGVPIYVQWLYLDAGAVQGVATSNAVMTIAQ